MTPAAYKELNSRLDELLVANGREPQDLKRSLMTGTRFGRTEQQVREKIARSGGDAQRLRDRGIVVGSGDEFSEQIKAFEEAGVQRIMLQWLELDDMDGLAAMAEVVLG